MLFLQIERILRSRLIDKLLVATSSDPSDNVLCDACANHSLAVYRGALSDVLGRYARAADSYKPRAIVRLTGDCPLADWTVIDLVVKTFKCGAFQYVSNVDPPTYPDGLNVEVISYEALRIADAEARLPSEREHVTLFTRNHPERFPATNVRAPEDLSKFRWTVDWPEDLALVQAVYEGLYPSKPDFDTADIMRFVGARPELAQLNGHIMRNESLRKSLAEDEAWRRAQACGELR